MGCSNSRKLPNLEEENMILIEELKLGFSKINCNRIDTIFKRYSVSFKLLPTQLLAAFRELKLNNSSYGQIDSPITKFYNMFKVKDRHFSQRKLSTLGVLLGKGTPQEKGAILFNIYDIIKDKSLDSSEICTLVQEIAEISLILLPKYAIESATDSEIKTRLVKYSKKLAGVVDTVVNFYQVVFSAENGALTFDSFVEKFKIREVAALSSSRKLRKLGIREHQRVIAPANLVRDFLMEANKTEERMMRLTLQRSSITEIGATFSKQ